MALTDLMERLTAFEAAGFPVVSLYLNAQANQHGRALLRYKIEEEARAANQ